jgi:hypothetical protein
VLETLRQLSFPLRFILPQLRETVAGAVKFRIVGDERESELKNAGKT